MVEIIWFSVQTVTEIMNLLTRFANPKSFPNFSKSLFSVFS
jgi:hypothetical protein